MEQCLRLGLGQEMNGGGGWMGGGSGRQDGQLAGHNSWPASVQFEACLLPK